MNTQQTLYNHRDPFHWLLRFALASTFLFHGFAKFGDLAGGAEKMGLPILIWTIVGIGEVLIGLGVLAAGAMQNKMGDIITRLCGIGAIIILAGAIAIVHWGQWSFSPSETHPLGGMEFQVILCLISAVFIARGNKT